MTAARGIDRWLPQVEQIREEAGGYTFECLAVAMILELGWCAAAKTAEALEPYIRGWGYKEEGLQADVAPLYNLLGWEQSALLHAWFDNLDNYREVRDTIGIAEAAR